jgi:hypothetical protein
MSQRLPNVLLEQRLARDSVIDPEARCILWMASRNASGYGQVRWQGRLWLTHRAAWLAKHGPIPLGLCVLHRCDVRPCINPDHLFLGTQKDNMADLAAKRGHERRVYDGRPERRPSKAPEIMRVQVLGQEFVARILEVRPLEPQADDVRSEAEARLIGVRTSQV